MLRSGLERHHQKVRMILKAGFEASARNYSFFFDRWSDPCPLCRKRCVSRSWITHDDVHGAVTDENVTALVQVKKDSAEASLADFIAAHAKDGTCTPFSA